MSRFTDPPPIARRFDKKRDWDAAREAAFNRAITNQTALACALRNLLAEVQVDVPLPRIPLLLAEQDAKRALELVGGPPSP